MVNAKLEKHPHAPLVHRPPHPGRGASVSVVAAALLLFAAAACAPEDGERGRSPGVGAEEEQAERAAAEAGEGTEGGDRPVCLEGGPFVADGPIPVDGGGADPGRISGLRWERHEGCERFVVDLETEPDREAPGGVGVEVLRGSGLIRVTAEGVREVDQDATDATFDGPLARAAYSAWAPDGRSTWVDLHLAEPAEASARVLGGPARVVIDLRPGGGALPPTAVTGQRVVVLEPRPGEVSFPLDVEGYARTFEANVVVRLEQDGREVEETFTTATAWADAWGHFELTLDDGPDGPFELHVGEYSARDGTWEGVTLDLVGR
ncbi:MAG: Gmad2 immunoglobulin-like domain-containing protein [Gemmatimonadota bacterium]